MNESKPPKKTTVTDGVPTSQPYLLGDPIPVAEVTELNTDSAWSLFEEMAEPETTPKSPPDAFAETVPAELEPMVEPPQTERPKK